MIKLFLTIALLFSINLYAQTATNVFEPTGSFAGLGTLTPENSEGWQSVLQVKGPANSKILTSSNEVIAGLWAHSTGYYGAPAGGIGGTFTAHPFSLITNSLTRMTISSNGNIGIGTTAPATLLELDAGNTRRGLTLTSQGNADAYADIQFVIKDQSSISAGKPVGWTISHRKDGFFSNSEANTSSLEFYGYRAGGGYFAPMSFKSNGDLVFVSDKNAIAGNVGIGTTSPREKLSVNGNIRAQEIKVEANNWPDYVFNHNYNLLELSELRAYIDRNHHLPDMPSPEQVNKEGISLGEMNSKFLKKIEELTLYLITKDKELKDERDVVQSQQLQIAVLKESLDQMLLRIQHLEKK